MSKDWTVLKMEEERLVEMTREGGRLQVGLVLAGWVDSIEFCNYSDACTSQNKRAVLPRRKRTLRPKD